MKNLRTICGVWLLAILGASALFAQDGNLSIEATRAYMIGPGDEITVKVLGEPQFDFVAVVDENGKIEGPFFEAAVAAQCRTESELRSDVIQQLKKYLKIPQASVRVTQRNSRPPVSIYGEVRQQQQFSLTRRSYLLEVISAAGGTTDKNGGMVQVFRTRPPLCDDVKSDNDWKLAGQNDFDVPSRMYSLATLRQGHKEANPEIFPGDIIVVQKASPVYVMGEVIRPGEFDIPAGGLPLSQAIAMAAGVTREAKSKSVTITRRKSGSNDTKTIVADYGLIKKGVQPDIMLEPFDQIVVDKAAKKFSEYLLDFIVGVPNRIPLRPL